MTLRPVVRGADGVERYHHGQLAVPRRCACRAPADYMCDFRPSRGTSCDAAICAACVCEIHPGKHVCQLHEVPAREALARAIAREGAQASAT
jgi:hypothetical protein